MMKPLDNGLKDNVPKAEPCSLLSSNTDVIHGSAFGFPENEPPVEKLLEDFAEMVVTAFFYERRNRK